jgi:hypothetical protein
MHIQPLNTAEAVMTIPRMRQRTDDSAERSDEAREGVQSVLCRGRLGEGGPVPSQMGNVVAAKTRIPRCRRARTESSRGFAKAGRSAGRSGLAPQG